MTTDTLFSRVRRLVSGGVNSLIDAAEAATPETVMRQSIREVDAAIDELRDRLGLILANRHHANKRLAEATSRHEELASQLRTAVAEKRDDLAEAVIARQLDLEAQMPVLESALNEAGNEAKEIEGYVAALNARKREMENDLAQFVASRDSVSSAPSGGPGAPAGNAIDRKVERAQGAFDRVLTRATGVAGTVASDRETAAKLAELEKLERSNRIRERLAAAKVKG